LRFLRAKAGSRIVPESYDFSATASWPQPAAMSMPRRWRTVLGSVELRGEDVLEALRRVGLRVGTPA
jgi:hypothetical protein